MQSDRQDHSTIEVGSNHSFGYVFTVVFVIVGLYPLLGGHSIRLWSIAIAAIFLGVTLIRPDSLAPLNQLWFKLGIFLGKIINPLVMLVIYIVTIIPIGLALRLFGKDLLRKKLDKHASSYWIERAPPGPEPDSLNEQF